jgi:YaiO family outer membrane protein
VRLIAIVGLVVWAAVSLRAQDTDAGQPALLPAQPFRVELGGYGNYFPNAGGWWRGFDSTVWIRTSPKFVPAITFDSRTSDAGTERYYSFFSYANWTPNFFTTQSISGTPDGGGAGLPLLFPRLRYDGKVWWKIPPRRRAVVGMGFSRYSLDNGQNSLILNPGVLYYKGSFVFDVEGFANRNEPGTFWSGSGLAAIQQGREGSHWVGITIGAGRQQYRDVLNLPIDIRYSSFSADAFYRRWLTRHSGFVLSGGYLDAFHTYHRYSVAMHLFFEF